MYKIFRVSSILCVALFFTSNTFSALPTNHSQQSFTRASTVFPNASVLDVTNFTTWVGADGFFRWDNGGLNGLNGTYPKDQNVGVVFGQGFLWGGQIHDDGTVLIRVNGSDYTNGLVPGKILYNSADDPSSGVLGPDTTNQRADYHVWRVRRNWADIDLTASAARIYGVEESQVTPDMIQTIHDQYQSDWNNWPAHLGAPFQEVDHDGVYTATVDTPGVPGATQTLWLVANDLFPGMSQSTYASPPIGIEIQITLWGYEAPEDSPYAEMQFQRYRMIYTGVPGGNDTAYIDSMYFEQWADPDIGYYGDDFSGTDTSRSLIYTYNSAVTDNLYSQLSLNPPAVGWNVLQGPITSENDTVSLASSLVFRSGEAVSDPDVLLYDGSLQWYNLMRGFWPRPEYPAHQPFINPLTQEPTSFYLTGNPLSDNGWVDGIELPPGDRRMMIGTGPFHMALGDTQEVIVAQNVAMGHSNLSSVYELWQNVDYSEMVYKNNFILPELADTVTTTPNIAIIQSNVTKESLTPDGILNNGESAIFHLTVQNNGTTLTNLNISGLSAQLTNAGNLYLESFAPGDTAGINIELSLPDNYDQDSTQLGFVVEQGSVHSDTFYTQVPTLIHNWDVSLHEASHTAGNAGGEFYYRIADPSQIKPHNYEVHLERDPDYTYYFTLKDITDDTELLSHQPVPDMNGYDLPVVDGLRLYSSGNQIGFDSHYAGILWITGVNWGGQGFFGGLDIGTNFFGSTVTFDQVEDVVINFSSDTTSGPADGWASKGAVFRRDENYSYDGTGYLPLAAYAIDRTGSARQVNVSFIEDASEGNANHRWDLGGWNGTSYSDSVLGGREYLFIHKSDYDEGASYDNNTDILLTDVMYGLWATQRSNHPYLEGDFTLSMSFEAPFASNDVYLITSPTTTEPSTHLPTSFQLAQNYPNPFNPTTTIEYALPRSGDVTLTVYNLLGKQVATLVQKPQKAGMYRIQWKSENLAGIPVASGVYFYRLTVQDGNKTIYNKVQKMILLR